MTVWSSIPIVARHTRHAREEPHVRMDGKRRPGVRTSGASRPNGSNSPRLGRSGHPSSGSVERAGDAAQLLVVPKQKCCAATTTNWSWRFCAAALCSGAHVRGRRLGRRFHRRGCRRGLLPRPLRCCLALLLGAPRRRLAERHARQAHAPLRPRRACQAGLCRAAVSVGGLCTRRVEHGRHPPLARAAAVCPLAALDAAEDAVHLAHVRRTRRMHGRWLG